VFGGLKAPAPSGPQHSLIDLDAMEFWNHYKVYEGMVRTIPYR